MNTEWQKFLNWPFSCQTRLLLQYLEVDDFPQLTQIPLTTIRKYRRVGPKCIAELRAALAHFGHQFADEVGTTIPTQEELPQLEHEQLQLEFRLREVRARIRQLKAANRREPPLSVRVLAAWLKSKNVDAVAAELSITPAKVRLLVKDTYRQKFRRGDLNEAEIAAAWQISQNDDVICQQYDLPDFVLHSMLRRTGHHKGDPVKFSL